MIFKKAPLILIFLSLTGKLISQGSSYLNYNNVNAMVNTCFAPLFNNYAINNAGFEVPAGSGKKTIYASNIWIGGKDSLGQLHLAAEMYSGDFDFIDGPVMDPQHYTSQLGNWDRLWVMDRPTTDYHILHYSDVGYTIPQVYLDWPAHGDTTLGQAANLAPFYDNNNDQSYNPADGDYPEFPGDKCIYFIFNDDTSHTESGGEKMKLEFHVFVYAFSCSDLALNHSIFAKYKIFNRSDMTYTDSYIGFWSDLDIGNPGDDYAGCDVQRGSYYGYDADSLDEGSLGYGNSHAAQGIVFLGGPHAETDNLDNPVTTNVQNAIDSAGIPYANLGLSYEDGIIDNERLGMTHSIVMSSITPTTPSDYYQYLYTSFNNQIINYDSTAIPCKYIYPGDSDPLFWGTAGNVVNDWSEITEANPSSDRRAMGSCGPFTFAPGQMHELDLAFVFGYGGASPGDPMEAVTVMNERIDSVRNYFNANITPCNSNFYTSVKNSSEFSEMPFSLYPNPTSHQFIIFCQGTEKQLSYSVSDILGKEITSGKINSRQTLIDCSGWAKGVYLVKMVDANSFATQKIVIE